MNTQTLEARITSLEKQVTGFRLLCLVQFLVIAFSCCFFILPRKVHASDSTQVLHAKGLIIEDAQGRARVLLGAPFPGVKDRARQDSTTTAMIFLDEKGHDRLTLGEEPNAQIQGKVNPNWHRIAPGFGVLIHDDQGNERGGYGWLGNGRAVLTLDRPNLDAFGAYVDDKTGFAGMVLEYPPDAANDVNGIEIGTQNKNAFVRFKDTQNKTKAVFNLNDGAPGFSTFDPQGKPVEQRFGGLE